MKREDENIDQLFKEAFAGDSFEFQEAYWQNAKQLLQKEKPKAWYYKPSAVATIILLFGIGISAALFSGLNTSDNENNIDITQSSSATPPSNSSFEPETKTTNSAIIPENETSFTENEEVTLLDSGFFDQEQTLSFTDSKKKTNGTLLQKSEPIHAEATLVNNPITGTSSTSIEEPTQNEQAMASALAVAQKTSSTTSTLANSNSSTENTLFSRDMETVNSLSSREKLSLLYLPTISLLDLENQSSLENVSQNTNSNSKKQISLPLSLRLSAGNLWSNGFNEGTQIDAQNLNMEFSAEYHLNSHWGIQLGLSYNQVIENQSFDNIETYESNYWDVQDNSFWDYQNEVVTTDGIWWLGSWWQTPSNDTLVDSTFVTQFDSNYVQQTDTSNSKLNANHQIKIIEIPLMVTYNIWINRWSVQLATGASIGIYSGSTGHVIINGDPTSIKNTESSLFNSIQYNYLLSTEVGYTITNHWQISLRPQMKMNLNSMYKNDSGFAQKFLYYGVNAGLVYRF